MQHKRHKMIYIILAIISILVLSFMINGCSYPTSPRALIPRFLDSEYKEYQRLCKEEIGKVLYARPVREGVRLEDIHITFPNFLVSDSIKLNIVSAASRESKSIIYIYIEGFKYYTNWSKTYFVKGNVREYIQCNFKEKYAMIKKIASKNKEHIGDEMIIEERRRIGRMDYVTSQKYISQVFKEAINAKSSLYIDFKEFQ